MSEFLKRGLGSWAQWRRRALRKEVIVYVTCLAHPRLDDCECEMDADTREWYDLHDCTPDAELNIAESGSLGAGLVPTD